MTLKPHITTRLGTRPPPPSRLKRGGSLASSFKYHIGLPVRSVGTVGAGADPLLPYCRHNPDGAKTLLSDDRQANGLDFTTQVSLLLDLQTGEIPAEQWKKIGVNLKLERMADFNQQLDDIHPRRAADIAPLCIALARPLVESERE